MKNPKTFRSSGLVFGLLLGALAMNGTELRADDAEDDESLPVLQGRAAIDYLTAHGLYDGLLAALQASRVGQAPVEEVSLAIAIADETALVGVRQDNVGKGAAYLFKLDDDGPRWRAARTLAAADARLNDQFGGAVAVLGNRALIGAWGKDANKGAVYALALNGKSWKQNVTGSFAPADAQAGDRFGNAIVLSGKQAAITAFGDDPNRAAVYEFQFRPNKSPEWVGSAKLYANDPAASDELAALSIAGIVRFGDNVSLIQDSGAPVALADAANAFPLADSAAGLAPDPGRIYLSSLTYGGSGCPQGSMGSSFANDRESVTLIFDSFAASTGPGVPVTEARKNCQLNINAHVPQGFSYSIATFDYRGYVQAASGGSAVQKSTYYFQGEVQQVNSGARFNGPVAKDYLDRDTVGVVAWMPCGRIVPINVNAQIRLIEDSLNLPGQITTDSIDSKIDTILGVRWRNC